MSTTTNGDSAMEEKLETLKTLNSRLLQKTVEHREQMDTLQQENSNLEAELTKSLTEKCALEDELKKVSEESEILEVQRSVLDVFMMTQMNVFSVELMGCLDSERKVVDELREKECVLENEIGKLRQECERVVNANDEFEQANEVLRVEKVAVEESLNSMVTEIEGLKMEVEKVAREKMDLEGEKSGQRVRIDELENEVLSLNKVVSDLRSEEEVLRGTVSKFERRCSEAMDREREMEREINVLRDEIGEKEKCIETLKGEKILISEKLDMMVKEVSDNEDVISKMVQEKNEVEEMKASRESENIELQKEVDSLKDFISALQESSKEQEGKIVELRDEIGDCRDVLDRITLERNDARYALDKEITNGTELKSRLVELENRIEENVDELKKIRAEREHLIRTKTDIESHAGLVVEEKEMVQKKLTEAYRNIDDLKSRNESANLGSEQALTTLKNILVFVNESREEGNGTGEVVSREGKLAGDVQPYAMELEAIKKAFAKKDKVVEEMKREIEYLQNSMGEERKKKSFWTLVSSATTIFAAISVAFAARGH